MWKTEIIMNTKAKKETIWQLWKDVEGWNKWDDSVEYSNIDGDFDENVIGTLKPNGGPKIKFKITKAIENNCFISQSKLPFCTIDFIHEVITTPEGIAIKHKIEMNGTLSFFFSKVMGKNMAKYLPNAVANLIRTAEK